jgi:hypothetical protein
MTRALADEATALRADVSRLGIGLVIVDSYGPACGPEPEGADAATRTMNALRSLGPATRLVVAHVSKAQADQSGPARPYGSIYVENLARSVWEIRRSSEDDAEDLLVSVVQRKVNRGRLRPMPIILRFAFEEDRVTLHSATVTDAPSLARTAPLGFRLRTMLATGALTTAELAEAAGVSTDMARTTLHRLAKKGQVMRLQDSKWGLAAR